MYDLLTRFFDTFSWHVPFLFLRQRMSPSPYVSLEYQESVPYDRMVRPGETQADHEEVMEFIDEVEFDRLGVFTYSREEDTPAATMPDQIDQDIMDTWRDELMALQQEISIDKSAQMVGKTIDVMVEGYIAEDNTYVGRSYKDAPNVDGMVFFECDRELMSGDFVSVKITGSTEYDLMGIMEENV